MSALARAGLAPRSCLLTTRGRKTGRPRTNPVAPVDMAGGANSGPDRRKLTATREGIQLHAWDASELSRKIAAEEMANGWPCKLDGRPVPSL